MISSIQGAYNYFENAVINLEIFNFIVEIAKFSE